MDPDFFPRYLGSYSFVCTSAQIFFFKINTIINPCRSNPYFSFTNTSIFNQFRKLEFFFQIPSMPPPFFLLKNKMDAPYMTSLDIKLMFFNPILFCLLIFFLWFSCRLKITLDGKTFYCTEDVGDRIEEGTCFISV